MRSSSTFNIPCLRAGIQILLAVGLVKAGLCVERHQTGNHQRSLLPAGRGPPVQMGPLLKVVNDVAEMLKQEFPGVLVSTLAYKDTVTPPTHIRPRDNVIIWLCTDAHSPHRLNYVTETKVTADAIMAWGKMGARSIIWDYPVEFNFLEPNLSLPVLADNIRFYIENGARGVFLQSADADNTAADHSYARSWISAKLLWDSSLDTAALLKVSCGATVSKQIIRSRKLIENNRELRSQVEELPPKFRQHL